MRTGVRIFAALTAMFVLVSCGPLIGAGAAVAVDEAQERENGGDGLF